jgi:hypothetical protein
MNEMEDIADHLTYLVFMFKTDKLELDLTCERDLFIKLKNQLIIELDELGNV